MKNWLHTFSCLLLSGALWLQPDSLHAQSGPGPLGVFDGHTDVGAVLHPGAVVYDAAHGTYTITGSGENMWLGKDAFQFLWKKTTGDVSISADIRFPHPGGNPHRKAALLIRQSLGTDAIYADAALHGVGLTALQFRPQVAAPTADVEFNFTNIADAPTRFRIEKRGDRFTMFFSIHGEPLHPSGADARLHLDDSFYVGLGVCSHDKDVSETAVFSNVVIQQLSPTSTASAKPDLYSTLQAISLNPDARRAVVAYMARDRFEAPNWTRDGKSLIFDQGGRIMTVPVDGRTPQPINIGQATGCNGSHGLSPDGKWLAISCNTPNAQGSRIYILPSAGGAPRMVTQNPSSYFHSWSPGGKTIAFTRPHPGGGDIWSISVEGGAETRLTTSTGISDDPDYSPDGQYIYFNSDRGGGSMQIWRMRADGSQPEQITSDERNNWTPHVSPDGKWMVFLSYDKNTPGHPANKEISLHLMSLADRKISNLVDLLGGSGTMNVPSWSPDSQHLAYVSYELIDPDLEAAK